MAQDARIALQIACVCDKRRRFKWTTQRGKTSSLELPQGWLTVREAARLHSFPDWFRLHRTKWHGFRQVGNAAGAGAQQLLISRERRGLAVELAGRARYLELTTHPEFAEHFVAAMRF